MKQKYTIRLDGGAKKLIIQEYAESDKDTLSLLCEESYDSAAVKTAASQGKAALIQALRSTNMYPPSIYADRIADAVVGLLETNDDQPIEVFFDDKELLGVEPTDGKPVVFSMEIEKEEVDIDMEDQLEEDTDNIDDLLDDEELRLKAPPSALKIADEDAVDLDEEP